MVAAEVRTLAQRTQTSAREIETMVGRLQQSSQRVHAAMQGSERKAASAMEATSMTGRSSEAIATAVRGISDSMMQIANATEEQTAVANEINRNVLAIRDVAHRGSAGMTQLEEASQQLSQLAGDLQGRASRFHGLSATRVVGPAATELNVREGPPLLQWLSAS